MQSNASIHASFMKSLHGLLVVFLALPALANAGAWPQRPGSGKATLGLSFLPANSVSDADGKKRSYAMNESGLSTYGEVGVAPRFSLGWAWGMLKHVQSDSADLTATTDPEFSVSWHAGRKENLVFALQVLTQFPLGPGNPEAVPDHAPAFFSHDAFALELKPLMGWSGGPWWMQGGLGLRARSEDLAWQFRYQAAAGRKVGTRFSGMLAFDGILPLDGQGSGRTGDQESYYGMHLAIDFRLLPAWQVGTQFDSMLTPGQEMPLGPRINLYARMGWR